MSSSTGAAVGPAALAAVHTRDTPIYGPDGVAYTMSLTLPDGRNAWAVSASMVPDSDIAAIRAVAGPSMPEQNLRGSLAINNLQNAICNYCMDKSNVTSLLLCTRCCMIWYCGNQCRDADWHNHSRRCGKPDGPLDTGPMRLAFARVVNPPEKKEAGKNDHVEPDSENDADSDEEVSTVRVCSSFCHDTC